MMAIERIDRKTYPSFGECIYCHRRPPEVILTDEHIIPFSLGANAVIENGSCTECARWITGTEDHVGRKILHSYRTHINEQTRRKAERPKTGNFTARINGELREFRDIPIPELPMFTPYPVWGLPGILDGKQPTSIFENPKASIFYWYPPDLPKKLGLKPGEVLTLPHPEYRVDCAKFARAVAKIGYCHAILERGLNGFRPLAITDLILGHYPCIPHFVGVPYEDPPPPNNAHVKHATQIIELQKGRFRLLVVSVRLYANSGLDGVGTPIYQVVVGSLLPKGREN